MAIHGGFATVISGADFKDVLGIEDVAGVAQPGSAAVGTSRGTLRQDGGSNPSTSLYPEAIWATCVAVEIVVPERELVPA